MISNILFLVAGLMLLIKGADYLVDGSSDIAKKFKVSGLVIGLTVVAFGTSAPELAVNVISSIQGNTEIALGNINGSNIANILLVIAITALITRIPVQSRTMIKEVPFMILAGVVLVFIMLDGPLEGAAGNIISRIDGIMLLCFFAIFLYYMYLSARDITTATIERAKYKLWKSVSLTIFGLVGLLLGAKLTVLGASGIALGLGITQGLVALTLIAVGTSLPELVTAIVAARKGETDLAVGNVVGSNIFNILFVLGITATITPIAVNLAQLTDALVALAAMLTLLIIIHTGKFLKKDANKDVSFNEGIFLLACYAVYIAFIVWRG